MRRCKRLVLFLAFFSVPFVIQAQTVPALILDTVRTTTLTYGLGLQIGYFKSADANEGATYFGVAGRIRFGSVLGLEGTIGYDGTQAFNFIKLVGQDLSAQVHSIPVTVSLLVNLPLQGGFLPYIVGGVGLYIISVDYSEDLNKVLADETPTKVGLHLGAGVEYPVSRSIGIYADYRYLFLGSVFSSGAQYDLTGKNFGGGKIIAGLLVYF